MLTGNQKSSLNQSHPRRRRADDDVLQQLQEYRQTHDPDLRDRIVLQYTNLVESVARRFAGVTESAEDLIQEGYIGLITAIDLYDPTKNVKFSTYATHFIIGQIKHCLRDRGKIIKEPAWLQELNQRMARVIEALAQDLDRPPTNLEIAAKMDMTEEAIAEILMTREIFKVTSIDGSGDAEEDAGGAVDLERRKGLDVAVTFQLPLEDRIVLEAATRQLKELEQKVVTEYYFRDLNQTEIARQLGISCNYVSHILRNSTKKLKKILVTDELRETQRKMVHLRRRLEEQQQALLDQNGIVDPLTRLYNRRYFESRLEEELSRASRMGSEVAVVFVKMEGLSAFMRIHGTIKGDAAIMETTQTIRRTVRRTDILTRYADDVFALILPYTGQTVQIVHARLDRALHACLEEKGWQTSRSPLSFGIGSAIYPHDGTQSLLLASLAQDASGATLALASLPRAA